MVSGMVLFSVNSGLDLRASIHPINWSIRHAPYAPSRVLRQFKRLQRIPRIGDMTFFYFDFTSFFSKERYHKALSQWHSTILNNKASEDCIIDMDPEYVKWDARATANSAIWLKKAKNGRADIWRPQQKAEDRFQSGGNCPDPNKARKESAPDRPPKCPSKKSTRAY